MRFQVVTLVCLLALAGCGGEKSGSGAPPPVAAPPPPPAAPLPPPVIGAAGGTVTEPTGASVVFPAGVVTSDTTFRIAMDSTGAPPVPAALTSVGNTYVITPHGGDFAEAVEVRIPAPTVTLQPNQELKLAKAQPGEQWDVLRDSELRNGTLTARVNSFSFFMVVVITYPLPLQQAVPFQATSTLLCGGQPCSNVLGPQTATYSITSNGGQLPANCSDDSLYIRHGEGWNASGPGGGSLPTVQLPRTGGTFSVSVLPNAYFYYTFAAGMRCDGWWSSLQINRSVTWATPPPFPNVSVLSMPAQLDVVEGFPANLDAIIAGGAYRNAVDIVTRIGLGLRTPTPIDRAIIDWERSDNGGSSWRVVSRSYQDEANKLPYGTGPEWQPWSARHGFIATSMDQGALIRAHACYTPPAEEGPPAPCVTGPATRINVLQQSSLPAIVTAPRSVLVRTGQTASLSVTTAGTPTPTLLWQTRAANSNDAWTSVTTGSGATSANYTTAATSTADNGTQYRVLLTNAVGSIASTAVTVSVSDLDVAPTITTQPASLSVTFGNDAVFAIDARGTEALSYKWSRNGAAIAGANSPVLRLTGVSAADSGSYVVSVSNSAGTIGSSAATLTVAAGAPAAVAPTIVTQPAPVTANAGSTATFAVGVDGTGPFTFQWRRDGVNIAGATSAVLTFDSVALPNAGSFSVVVSNSAGSATSNSVMLDVTAVSTPTAPVITNQPSTLITPYLGSGVVAVGATGSGPLSYQWSRNGEVLPGLTLPVLAFTRVADQDVGRYTVTVSNSVGSVVSRAIDIILLGAPVITQQPESATAFEGENAFFFVRASSLGLRYQWLVNGNPILGAIGSTWNTGPVVTANSGAVYSVMVYNGAGLVFSQAAVLTVQTVVAPTIIQHPQNVTIEPGLQAQMCVTIGGTPTFDVQLQRWNGSAWAPGIDVLVNANTQVCYLTEPLTLADNGAQYRFVVDNSAGEMVSNTATVTVRAQSGAVVTNTTLVSRALIGGPPNNISDQPSISADGRYVAFVSNGTNLSADTERSGNAYVRDMLTGDTRLINYNYNGGESEHGVLSVKLSSNGRYVIFASGAGDLVPGDTNNSMDIFRRDLLTGTNQRVSVMPNGDELESGVGDDVDYQLGISADGQVVTFLSAYSIDPDSYTNRYYHLFYRDLSSGFSRDVAGSSENRVADSALSDDGKTIAIVMGATSRSQTVDLYDIEANSYSTVFGVDTSGSPAGLSQGMSISSNGRYVAFSILTSDVSPHNQVMVADRNTRTSVVASMNLGAWGDGNSAWPEISGDGRYVMFSTIAPSLTNNLATSSKPYVVVRDLVDQKTSVASLRSDRTEVSAGTFVNEQHALSEDGTTLAFVTDTLDMGMGKFGAQVFAAPRP